MIDTRSTEAPKTREAAGFDPRALLEHLSLPLFTFSAVFLGAILALALLLEPTRFRVHTGETVVRLRDLEQEEEHLSVREAQLKREHAELKQRQPTPSLSLLSAMKQHITPLGGALAAVVTSHESFGRGTDTPIHIDSVSYDGARHRLSLRGRVDDTAAGSIQLLAAFMDSLRRSPAFTSVSEPEYVQQRDGDGRNFSPFAFIIIPHASAEHP